MVQQWVKIIGKTDVLPVPAGASPPDPVQTCQPGGAKKRQLDEGKDQDPNLYSAEPRSKRSRHHYPTPEGHFEEEQQWPESEEATETAL